MPIFVQYIPRGARLSHCGVERAMPCRAATSDRFHAVRAGVPLQDCVLRRGGGGGLGWPRCDGVDLLRVVSQLGRCTLTDALVFLQPYLVTGPRSSRPRRACDRSLGGDRRNRKPLSSLVALESSRRTIAFTDPAPSQMERRGARAQPTERGEDDGGADLTRRP